MEQVAWVVVVLAVISAVVWFVLRGRRDRTPDAAAATGYVEDPWEQADAEDAWGEHEQEHEEEMVEEPPADPTPAPPQVMTRDSLVNRDRRLDPTKWDNHTGAGDGGGGGGGLDASFFENLRRRQADGDRT